MVEFGKIGAYMFIIALASEALGFILSLIGIYVPLKIGAIMVLVGLIGISFAVMCND